MKYGATDEPCDGCPLFGLVGQFLRDEPLVGHSLKRVIASASGRLEIDVGALAHVALDDAGEQCPFFEGHVSNRLAKVNLRRGLHAVGTMPPVDLVAVHREDLLLRVPLLDLHGDERLADFALVTAVANGKADFAGKQIARELLRQRTGARRSSWRHEVADKREDHARNAEAGMIEEAAVLGRDDGVAQVFGNLLIGHEDATLDGEVADHGAVAVEHSRDGVWRVLVKRGDEGQVAGIGENDTAHRA
jgi:hypothetical protein